VSEHNITRRRELVVHLTLYRQVPGYLEQLQQRFRDRVVREPRAEARQSDANERTGRQGPEQDPQEADTEPNSSSGSEMESDGEDDDDEL